MLTFKNLKISIHRITSASNKNYFSTNIICSGCVFYEMLCWALQTAPYGSQGSQAASVNHKGLWSTALWTIEAYDSQGCEICLEVDLKCPVLPDANGWGVGGTRRQLFLARLAGCTTVLVSQTLACCNCVIDWTATVSPGLRVGHKEGRTRGGAAQSEKMHIPQILLLWPRAHIKSYTGRVCAQRSK